MWKENGSPRQGHIFNIRRITRAKYHQAIHYVKKYKNYICNNKLAQSLNDNKTNCFWSKIKNISEGKNNHNRPNNIDGHFVPNDICNHFANKYEHLYNSVNYDVDEMNKFVESIDSEIHNNCCNDKCINHNIDVSDVMYGINKLRNGKHDGFSNLYSDHLKYGPDKLAIILSLLFTTMIKHGTVPTGYTFSTILPIVKNKRKNLTSSDNYRAIALSSVMVKILDNIILNKFSDTLVSSDLQFGFKKKHSTIMCSFIVEEVIQYYKNNNTPINVCLLDASKAFDCVHYIKLFKLLRKKGMCPLFCKFLIVLYTNQTAHVKWNYSSSKTFIVRNGVKQGGVLSPFLFCIYIDELLMRLK